MHDSLPAAYQGFYHDVSQTIEPARLITDPLRTLAFGTDASFYRLIPRIVVEAESEAEIQLLLEQAHRYQLPVTFRAAGTSLSGQAISDSILIRLGRGWQNHRIEQEGHLIHLQPGVIGAQANAWLAPFGRKIGPDPASINSCKIGGIAANNASGMCCGTAHNSYHTLAGMRLILADGTLLDSRSELGRDAFRQQQGPLLAALAQLARETAAQPELAERIRHKYRLKNTTGYSLNALLDFDDPIDILQHLMIGSEGTLGCITEVSYHTVPEPAHKASSLVLFPTVEVACQAVAAVKATPVSAVELMDRRALASVEDKPGMPPFIAQLGAEAAALLIEAGAETAALLQEQIEAITQALSPFEQLPSIAFTSDPEQYAQLWAIRKGLFPAVGAVRETGTTVIIEDVAFPVEHLAEGVRKLEALFVKYHYNEAIIFGHALEGNLHFVFTQDFSTSEEVSRYSGFMDEVAQLVAVEYGGSLKAEHGTGRNMAPYVELEWGSDAYRLMQRLKQLLDPAGLLNPGVIINDNPHAHLEDLKQLPAANELIDKCIECGFCEAVCPSAQLSITPRQRIVLWREIQHLQREGSDPQRLAQLQKDYQYFGIDSCAVDGLCSLRCPVGINTGELTLQLRQQRNQKHEGKAQWLADHFAGASRVTRTTLKVADTTHGLLGSQLMGKITGAARKLSGGAVQQWTPSMPTAAPALSRQPEYNRGLGNDAPRVVYLPSCASQVMGPARGESDSTPLTQKTIALLNKAGFYVVIPEQLSSLCCGQPFASKGMPAQANQKLDEWQQAMLKASDNGAYPIYCDTSPCVLRAKNGALDPRLQLFEPLAFIDQYLLPRLQIDPVDETIAVHITCSTQRLGHSALLTGLVKRCARRVFVPEEITCCGFAGDKGFSLPELNAAALGSLRQQLPGDCREGVSTSRTCEIGLSHHSGIPYHSVVYLLDRVSRPLAAEPSR
ncbi:FAD-binding and (Fe-S)-binding domain-containing protein [Aestuariirhabdus litorea]|uniref:D-lactate dehydrogenase (cytochrome) n=1 Tax=Aestuariirhabdus litorea TaxID=2528527 RepID=A0A3P3VKE3_9GAMM|nr:FAD-binding and (Fe-S)-binding domain-containing protein [Aestuariirhabdus litorea]RRJ83202.1 FAD-binding oxidoreductase [Aestuariirhabdus litorea]RWW93359.1 FAD-binding protein [Endozoicomonadaceae bacterium GTF-13]